MNEHARGPRIEGGAVAQERIEEAGHAAGEGHDGEMFAAARGDAERPGPERLGLGRSAAEDGDGDLNQEPAHPGLSCLGNGAAALRLPRAELARDEADGGFDLVGVTEALDVVDRGDEGDSGDGPDAGDGAQALDALTVRGDVLDHLVRIGELGISPT